MNTDLAEAVHLLAAATHSMSDSDLGQPFQWGAHREGVRFALLGAMHELRALAVQLASDRRRANIPLTRVQHALAQYNAAYRDLDAALLGVNDKDYDQLPAPGEWPLRYVYGHMVGAERNFFALIHYGLRRQREAGELPVLLPEGEANRLLGPFEAFRDIMESGTREEIAAFHARHRHRAMVEFAGIKDNELDGPSTWWEGEPYSLEYRIHRMDAHLRQHTVQIDKTRDQLGQPAGEARRLLRLVYSALAEVEGALIGSPGIGADEIGAFTGSIHRLAQEAVAAVNQAHAMIAAVTGGDRERVGALLAEDPHLANATSQDGIPIVRLAAYYGQDSIVESILESPEVELEIWDGAALGRLPDVEQAHKAWGNIILNEISRDGYTPLQLASFFGREEVARYLIAEGAAIDAVSRNAMKIQPIHAACAGSHTTIVRMLLEAGADPNVEQQDGFRPLHSAAQNGNADLVRLLLEHGANPALADAQGRLPSKLAEDEGFLELAGML